MIFWDLFWSFFFRKKDLLGPFLVFSPLQPFFGKNVLFCFFSKKMIRWDLFGLFGFFFLKNDFLGPFFVFFASAAFFWKKVSFLVFFFLEKC